MSFRNWTSALALTIVAAASAPTMVAQTVAGTISGLITDPSGSAIAGAMIVVTDIDRNVNIRSTSNESGFYLVTPVPPGRYRVRAEKQGFRAFILESMPIATQQKATVNVALQVGAVTESVTTLGVAVPPREVAIERGGHSVFSCSVT